MIPTPNGKLRCLRCAPGLHKTTHDLASGGLRSLRALRAPLAAILLALIAGLGTAVAQDLTVDLASTKEVTFADDRFTYIVTVANEGSGDLLNVNAAIAIPDNIDPFFALASDGFTCSSGICDPGEVGNWAVGTLRPGDTRSLFLTVDVAAGAPETLISNSVTATASGESPADDNLDIAIDPTPLLRLGVYPGAGPAAPGDEFTYVLAYGNIGSNSPSNVELRAEIPSGTTFVVASEGGTLNGGVVTWPLGLVGPGGGGEAWLKLEMDSGLPEGRLVELHAELDPNLSGEYTAATTLPTPIAASNPLQIEYTIDQATSSPDGAPLTYVLTASNTGSVDLTGVRARIQVPLGLADYFDDAVQDWDCSNGVCDAGEIGTWDIGTLAPGETRNLFFRAAIRSGVSQGEAFGSVARIEADGAKQVLAWQGVTVDPSPTLELGLAAESGPMAPGEPYEFVITYGNVGSVVPTTTTLDFRIPEHASFVSATDGGSASGEFVSWDIGLLGPGDGGIVRVVVLPDAALDEGELLRAEARIDPQLPTERTISASTCTEISNGNPLEMKCAISQTSGAQGDEVTYTFFASNTGLVDLKNVRVRVLIPDEATSVFDQDGEGWTCPNGTCSPNQVANWSISLLAPGETRAVVHRTFVASSARSGGILRALMTGESSMTPQIKASHDVSVDPSPLMRVSLVADKSPVGSNGEFEYSISYGNLGSASPSDVVLRLHLPEEVDPIELSGSGTHTDGIVTWNLGPVGPGGGDERTVRVQVNGALEGEILEAYAELDTGLSNERLICSMRNVSVRNDVPLQIVAAADQAVVAPGGLITYTLTISNTGVVDLTDVSVRSTYPGLISNFFSRSSEDFNCSSGVCNPNEIGIWTIPQLRPAESRTLVFQTTAIAGAPQGEILRMPIVAYATSTGYLLTHQNVSLDTSPIFSLGLAGEELPTEPDGDYQFTLTYGNVVGGAESGTIRLEIPDGMSFVSASDDAFESDGTVFWGTGVLGLADGGKVTANLQFDGDTVEGDVFEAIASIDPGSSNEYLMRAESTVAVKSDHALLLEFDADRTSVAGSDSLYYTVVVTNRGPVELDDVTVRVQLPQEIRNFFDQDGEGFLCTGGVCNPGEIAVWNVAGLGAGASSTLEIGTLLIDEPTRGDQIRATAWAFAAQANQVSAEIDVLIGDIFAPVTTDAEDPGTSPATLQLAARCFPSPVATRAQFEITAPDARPARIRIYDASGRCVSTVFDGHLTAGMNAISWDARELSSGVYMYRLETQGEAVSGRVLKVR